jgi:4-diphosphocytidyl-2-C-methyl-D-erythritol kinase
MISFPNAKINLGLHITSKRADGYHNIDSCFYPIPLYDVLEIIEANETTLNTSGLDIDGSHSDNLIWKAYNLLKQDYDLSALEIHLLKKIPMGAGMGGGSADGAFMLKLLNEYFKLGLNTKELEKYALQLGSDCPFFVENTAKHVTGLRFKGLLASPYLPGHSYQY